MSQAPNVRGSIGKKCCASTIYMTAFVHWLTDATIAPPPKKKKLAIFLQRMFRGCSTRGWMPWEKISWHAFLFAKGYRTMTSGLAKGTVFQEIRQGAGFKIGDFVTKKKWGNLP